MQYIYTDLTIPDRYIYTGRISYDADKNIDWINLLNGASKFRLLDLLTAIENYLMDKQEEWIQQNIITVHKCAESVASLNKLSDYCNQIMVSHPDIIFKSNDLATLPKEILITLIKDDKLDIDENDLWMLVIQWATKQVPGRELANDIESWSSNDVNTVKETIADFIPHIRFFSISYNKIMMDEDLLPKKLRHDVLSYHIDKNYKPTTHMLPPRTGQGPDIDSLIINKKQAKWISSKIVEPARLLQKNQRTPMKHDVHKFTLLYRRSRDGNTIAKFRELCCNKGPTIAVGQVLGTEEILGGYNPVAWGHKNGDWVLAKESFIFALDKHRNENIVSFLVNSDNSSIYDSNGHFPYFGRGSDLSFGNQPYARKESYQVPLRDSSSEFEWVDWEVFLVSIL